MNEISAQRASEVLNALEARKGQRFARLVVVLYNVRELTIGHSVPVFAQILAPMSEVFVEMVDLAGFHDDLDAALEATDILAKAIAADKQELRK